jgi:hypothetical protein
MQLFISDQWKLLASSTRASKHMADNKDRKSGEVFWTKEQMEDLLHHYENEVELWDISNSNYSKKDARQSVGYIKQ